MSSNSAKRLLLVQGFLTEMVEVGEVDFLCLPGRGFSARQTLSLAYTHLDL